MKARKDVHIGREIERVLHERGITVTEFANRICCHRKNVYDIFTRKSIDIDRLIRISEALDYDFILGVYYPGIGKIEAGNEQEFRLLYKNGVLRVATE